MTATLNTQPTTSDEPPLVNTIYDALVYEFGDPKDIPWGASDFHWPQEEVADDA